jgi:hypothetical protein
MKVLLPCMKDETAADGRRRGTVAPHWGSEWINTCFRTADAKEIEELLVVVVRTK